MVGAASRRKYDRGKMPLPQKSRTYLKNSRSRPRARREPIRRRPKKRAMAGQAQKRSPPEADEHFKEAHNTAIGR
jgi:PIN domain nuclease of toxin-antitoxin system